MKIDTNSIMKFAQLKLQFNRSVSDMDTEDLNAYEASLDLLFEKDQESLVYLIEKAKIYEYKKNYTNAYICYHKSLLIFPDNPYVLFKEACCLKILGKIMEAIEAFKHCIALNSKTNLNQMINNINIDNINIEQQYLTFLQSSQKKYIDEAFYELGNLYFEQQQYYDAINTYKQIGNESIYFRNAIYCIAKSIIILMENSEEVKEIYIKDLIYCLNNNPSFQESREIFEKIWDLSVHGSNSSNSGTDHEISHNDEKFLDK